MTKIEKNIYFLNMNNIFIYKVLLTRNKYRFVKHFSCEKYGDDNAYELAKKYRDDMLKYLDGPI